MIRQSGKARRIKARRIMLQPPVAPGLRLGYAAALTPVGTVEIVFRICEAIW
jgi:hypothetical protein